MGYIFFINPFRFIDIFGFLLYPFSFVNENIEKKVTMTAARKKEDIAPLTPNPI